jgi:methylated-DNA-[protein]-cysteine S-methyltransferase
MVLRTQRCTPPGGALSFVWTCAPEGGLLAADWIEETPDQMSPAPPGSGFAPAKHPPSPAGAPVPVPFDPADFFRDPHYWRPPGDLPPGSAHARRVWRALCAIPVGETRSYGEIARAIGSSPRAVGQACRANPWPLFVPCHRVVPASGIGSASAGGYAGQRDGPLAHIKAWLLAHETGARDQGPR